MNWSWELFHQHPSERHPRCVLVRRHTKQNRIWNVGRVCLRRALFFACLNCVRKARKSSLCQKVKSVSRSRAINRRNSSFLLCRRRCSRLRVDEIWISQFPSNGISKGSEKKKWAEAFKLPVSARLLRNLVYSSTRRPTTRLYNGNRIPAKKRLMFDEVWNWNSYWQLLNVVGKHTLSHAARL